MQNMSTPPPLPPTSTRPASFKQRVRATARWVNDDGVLSGALLQDPRGDEGDAEELLPCAGAFLAIGHKPMTSFLRSPLSMVELDEDGYIVHKEVPDSFPASQSPPKRRGGF